MNDDLFTAIAGVIGTLLVTSLFFLGARQFNHHNQVSTCRTFGQISGYETRFVDYNFFKYECQAKTKNGNWIPSDRLREID